MSKFILVHKQAKQNAARALAMAPDGFVVTIAPAVRDGQHNSALHALLTEVAKTQTWCGRRWSQDTWKRLLVAAWARAEGRQVLELPALDGHGVDIVFKRTSLLNNAEVQSLIEYIHAWKAQESA